MPYIYILIINKLKIILKIINQKPTQYNLFS